VTSGTQHSDCELSDCGGTIVDRELIEIGRAEDLGNPTRERDPGW